MKSCSQQNFEFLSAEILSTLATTVKTNATRDDCLIDSFKDAVSEVSSKLMVNKLATDLEPLTGTFMKNHKSEMFWKLYFGFIKDYNTYFSKVLVNLGEKNLAACQKNRKTTHQPKPEDKDSGESRNDDILQYLGGYVLQQLCKKIQIYPLCDTDNSKEMYNILKVGKSENVNNQKLVNCKTRGGLWWGITHPCLNIFKMAEMVFMDKVNVSNFRSWFE